MINESTLAQESFYDLLKNNDEEKFQALSGFWSMLVFSIFISMALINFWFKQNPAGAMCMGFFDFFTVTGLLLYTVFTIAYYSDSFTKRWRKVKGTNYGIALADIQRHLINVTPFSTDVALKTQNSLWCEAHYKLGLVNVDVPVPKCLREESVEKQKENELLSRVELYRDVLLQNPEQTIVNKSLKELNG